MRVCPKCNSKVSNPNAHFCFECGGRLFSREENEFSKEESVQGSESISSLTQNEKKPDFKEKKEDVKSKRWNYAVVGSNVLSILFLVTALSVFFRFGFNNIDAQRAPLVSINNVEIASTELTDTLTSSIFKVDYHNLVPTDVLFYSESSGIAKALPEILSDEQIAYIEGSYDLSIDDLLIFFKSDFSYIKPDLDSWAVIARAGGIDFFDRTFAEYEENKAEDEPVASARVGDYLVISNSKVFIEEIKETHNGNILSINQNEDFKSNLQMALKEDPVFFAYSNSSDYIEEGLRDDLSNFGLEETYNEIEGTGVRSFIIKQQDGNLVLKKF